MSDPRAARWARVRALFDAARKKPAEERMQYLTDECGGDPELVEEVSGLLAAAESDDRRIEKIVSDAAADLTRADGSARLEQRVGSYRLVGLLGTGGMGNVYLARRDDEQFEHQVAIKVLQTGRRDPQFVQRFLAERQVLANLDHPNICRLLDGGETDDGVPYLVMEYVRGIPIDVYCDEQRLTVVERLELFQRVCLAIDYAHRNLVVHRDVKPSNILITDEGEPKLLDFGIAKLIDDSGIATGNLTVEAARMLTPEFASPEQVRGEPVAIATDVYSLGVLLYRLLCGRGPYRRRGDLPADLARAILEDVPSRPSIALVTAGEDHGPADTEISARRHTTTSRLRSRLSGDLDNIVLMALRKEPERRYPSAKALSDDLDNYLSYRPVSARPDHVAYRAGKFLRRHRSGLAATLLVLAVVGFAVFQIVDQRNRAELAAVQSEQVTAFLSELFASASLGNTAGEVLTAADLLEQGIADIEQLDDQPAVQGRLLHIMGDSYAWIGEHAAAEPLLRRSVELLRDHAPDDKEEIAAAINNLGDNERLLGHLDNALALFRESLGIWRQLHGENHPAVAYLLGRIGDTYRLQARFDEARASLEEAVAIKEALGELHDSGGIDIRGNLVLVIDESGHTDEAIELLREVVADSRRVDGEKHPNTIIRTANLGLMQNKIGLYEEALANNTIAYNFGREVWTTDYRNQSWVTYHRGYSLRALGRLGEAEAAHLEAVSLREQQSGVGSPATINALWRLGLHYVEVGRFDDARDALERSIAIATAAGQSPGRDVGRALVQMARLSNLVGDYDAAAGHALEAIAQADYLGWLTLAWARRELAVSASGLGRNDAATTMFDAVFNEFRDRSGKDTVEMLPFLHAATRHYRKLGDTAKALDYAGRAYRVSERIRPPTAWPAALARGEYGLTLSAAGDPEEGAPLLTAARRQLAAVFGDTDWRVRELNDELPSRNSP